MNIIKKIPIPIAGLMLALFSLGNLLQDIHPYIRHLFGFFGAIILVSIILKVVLCLEDVKQDFKNPVIVSSSGTFSMSVMLISYIHYKFCAKYCICYLDNWNCITFNANDLLYLSFYHM